MLNTRGFLYFSLIIIFLINFSNQYDNIKNEFYILNWGHGKLPLWYLNGTQYFIDKKCKYVNCYITSNNNFFKDKRLFDAIIFDAVDLSHVRKRKYLPSGKFRSEEQKYIFTSLESQDNYPLCEPHLDSFFNWTWTYKLDSTFRRTYITVYDKKHNPVGPKAHKKWRKHMKPIDQRLKEKLKRKSRLAAWFVSRCKSKGKREEFVNEVQRFLKKLGGEAVDVYGKCGPYDCPKMDKKCARMLKSDYKFYFAFENSLSPDYVTEKLMTALDNYNIPVVYGGADYSRFLPPGSYLNARKLGPEMLARKMLDISKNKTAFYDFFRWRNHFVFEDTTDTESMCNLCAMMNSYTMFTKKTIITDFVKWWNEGKCGEMNKL